MTVIPAIIIRLKKYSIIVNIIFKKRFMSSADLFISLLSFYPIPTHMLLQSKSFMLVVISIKTTSFSHKLHQKILSSLPLPSGFSTALTSYILIEACYWYSRWWRHFHNYYCYFVNHTINIILITYYHRYHSTFFISCSKSLADIWKMLDLHCWSYF